MRVMYCPDCRRFFQEIQSKSKNRLDSKHGPEVPGFEDFGEFEFKNRTVDDQEQSDCKFGIQIYQDSIADRGQPVMLYACVDGQKMMVSCKNNKEVFPEPMDVGERINGTGHKALFQWKLISTGKYKFESTMYTGHFLAFEPSEDKPCLHKLILRQAPKDEVDEPIVIGVKSCSLE